MQSTTSRFLEKLIFQPTTIEPGSIHYMKPEYANHAISASKGNFDRLKKMNFNQFRLSPSRATQDLQSSLHAIISFASMVEDNLLVLINVSDDVWINDSLMLATQNLVESIEGSKVSVLFVYSGAYANPFWSMLSNEIDKMSSR